MCTVLRTVTQSDINDFKIYTFSIQLSLMSEKGGEI